MHFTKHDKFIENSRLRESELAGQAIKQYGSLEKFLEATKKNFNIEKDNMENMSTIKKEDLDYYINKDDELYKILTDDITKDPFSKEVQKIVHEIVNLTDEKFRFLNIDKKDKGEKYWDIFAENHLSDSATIKILDEKYGMGACKFIGKAFRFYAENEK